MISPGDMALRHDIQRLADAGIIKGPVTTWPLAWGPIIEDIRGIENKDKLSRDVIDAINRVSARADWETRTKELTFRAKASVAEEPTRIRSFQNTPRESAEVSAGISYTGDWFAVSLNGQAVDGLSHGVAIDSPKGDEVIRNDDSMIGVTLGNYSITANTLDRWWGPGWDGSLIFSSNARPMPAISIDRNFTDAFKTKWLSWLGPWDVSTHFAKMERDRFVPNTHIFAMRVTFKPFPSLELGLSRIAQWCGNGRPCDLSTFVKMFTGRDNRGQAGITPENEPGNQQSGFDARWSTTIFDRPVALYGQYIGEDESNRLPADNFGLFGLESSGLWDKHWSYRWFSEIAITISDFTKSEDKYNSVYNHSVYLTGLRYRGRVIGHGIDNDSRVISTGLILVNDEETQWHALFRFGALNRAGVPDERNSLTPTKQDIVSLDVSHSKVFKYGQIDIGLGFERIDDIASGESSNETRAYLQWRSSY
jgi:hypothetical protein